MGSRLVYDMALHLCTLGARVARVDFRGVGRSAGTYGYGEGEVSDALAVLSHLENRFQPGSRPLRFDPGQEALPVAGAREVPHADQLPAGGETGNAGSHPSVVGYSFGGAVALRVATQRPLAHLVTVGTPLRLEGSRLEPEQDARRLGQTQPGTTIAMVVGDRDELVPLADARRLASCFVPPVEMQVIPGAGHFLEPSRNAAAAAAVASALGLRGSSRS